jgi:formiminotetrahydrofolate cyclodeaminase
VAGLGSQPLAALLDEVAAPTPAPGGGSSAACTAALAAALVEMAARLADGSDLPPETADRAGALRARALELAERELSSYEPVLAALRLPADDPARAERLRAALLEASRSPLAIAEAAAEVAGLGVEVARASSPSVRGDALTGTLLAESAAVAAATLVAINLAGQPAHDLLRQAEAARARASRAREDAEALGAAGPGSTDPGG